MGMIAYRLASFLPFLLLSFHCFRHLPSYVYLWKYKYFSTNDVDISLSVFHTQMVLCEAVLRVGIED